MDFEKTRAERFLIMYRKLEGMLERRYAGRQSPPASVIKEYLRDPDSEPLRADLDLCREIRNILSHNADDAGSAVVEPSEGVLRALQNILDHVKKPQLAVNYGTPADRIMFAHPNDMAINVMRHMLKRGYSHVPVSDKTGLVGIFSAESLLLFSAGKGLSEVRDELRIGEMKSAIDFGDEHSQRYMFLPEDATVLTVKDAFEKRTERNNRLAVVFLTRDGTRRTDIVAMLTPWDVLREDVT